MKTITITVFAVLMLGFTCERIPKEEIDYLKYGTSFGECLGYCKKEVLVSGQAVFTKSGWDMEGALPDSSCSIVFFTDPLPQYLEKLDIEAFMAMEEVIGCPDCADGGAEWLELSNDGLVKRVTFEYYNEPEELSEIIQSLRNLMSTFNECR